MLIEPRGERGGLLALVAAAGAGHRDEVGRAPRLSSELYQAVATDSPKVRLQAVISNPQLGGMDMGALLDRIKKQDGKVGYILLWLLGIPIPILVGVFVLRGCN